MGSLAPEPEMFVLLVLIQVSRCSKCSFPMCDLIAAVTRLSLPPQLDVSENNLGLHLKLLFHESLG